MKTAIAAWSSRGGKYVITLYRDALGYTYSGDGCMGNMGQFPSDTAAIAALQARMDAGYFQADSNKTPMRRLVLTPLEGGR